MLKIFVPRGFLGGSVVENPPANAGHGFDPWSGNVPHATEQLSPWATTTELVLQSPGAVSTEPWRPRACALQQEKPPQWQAREKSHAAMKTQHSQKQRNNLHYQKSISPLMPGWFLPALGLSCPLIIDQSLSFFFFCIFTFYRKRVAYLSSFGGN